MSRTAGSSPAASGLTHHLEDFLNCVRTRGKPQCNEDQALVETATLMMSVEAHRQKRLVRRDPAREEIVQGSFPGNHPHLA